MNLNFIKIMDVQKVETIIVLLKKIKLFQKSEATCYYRNNN